LDRLLAFRAGHFLVSNCVFDHLKRHFDLINVRSALDRTVHVAGKSSTNSTVLQLGFNRADAIFSIVQSWPNRRISE
jgi:hypothetical protein